MPQVTIRYDNAYATIEGDPKALAEAKREVSYRPPGYTFAPSYRKGHWDGWRTLMRANCSFPTGLVYDVSKHLRNQGYDVTILDKRGGPPEPEAWMLDIPQQINLDTHQQEAIDAIRSRSRGVIYQDVSAGKSVEIAEAVRQLAVPGLVVVGRKELLKQQYDRFVQLPPNGIGFPAKHVGIIGGGEYRPSTVTVAMINSIRARLSDEWRAADMIKLLALCKQLHIDECHHLPAASYMLLTNNMPNAYYRAGYSATPHKSRTDDKVNREAYLYVTGATGPVISYLSPSDNIETGRSVGAEIFMVDAPGPDPQEIEGYIEWRDKHGVKKRRPKYNYQMAVSTGIVHNSERNKLIAKLATRLARHGATIVLAERVEHGKLLRSELLDAGLEEET